MIMNLMKTSCVILVCKHMFYRCYLSAKDYNLKKIEMNLIKYISLSSKG